MTGADPRRSVQGLTKFRETQRRTCAFKAISQGNVKSSLGDSTRLVKRIVRGVSLNWKTSIMVLSCSLASVCSFK